MQNLQQEKTLTIQTLLNKERTQNELKSELFESSDEKNFNTIFDYIL
jgi:hypothetical protein